MAEASLRVATGAGGARGGGSAAAARRRGRQRALVVLLVAALALGGYALLHTPRFLVRRLEIRGLIQLTPAQIVRAVHLPPGSYLWQVRPWNVAARLRELPLVRSAGVSLVWPDVLRIAVVERQPVAILLYRPGYGVEVDHRGRALALVDLSQTAADLVPPRRAAAGTAGRAGGSAAAGPASTSSPSTSSASISSGPSSGSTSSGPSAASPSPSTSAASASSGRSAVAQSGSALPAPPGLPLVAGVGLASVHPGELLTAAGVHTAVEVALGLGAQGRAAVTRIRVASGGQVTLLTRAGIPVHFGNGSNARVKTEVLLGLLQQVRSRGLHVADIDVAAASNPTVRLQPSSPPKRAVVPAAPRASAAAAVRQPASPSPRTATNPHRSPTGRNLLPVQHGGIAAGPRE